MTSIRRGKKQSSNDWKKALVIKDSSLSTVINNLNESGCKISLIIDKEKKFIGTITDGDIRRGILKGMTLNQNIDKIINKKPVIVTDINSKDAIIKTMIDKRIQQIPLIDSNSHVVGLIRLDELMTQKKINNSIFIMAGGKGTRLEEITEKIPKPMIKLGNKPILEHIINHAINCGFENFYLSVNYLSNIIEDYFRDGSKLGIEINYIREKSSLGTAGSLSLLGENLKQPILLTNADIITKLNYQDIINFHNYYNADLTVVVKTHEYQNPYGVINLKGEEIVNIEEKPTYKSFVNAGIYVLNPKIIEKLEKNKYCDMTDFIKSLKKINTKILAYPLHEEWHDIGDKKELFDAQNSFNGEIK